MFEIFFKISIPFYLVSLLTGILLFHKIDINARFVLLFLIVEISVEIIGYYMRINKISNLWLYNLFLLFETILFSGIFVKFIEPKIIKKIIIGVVIIFFLLWIYYNLLAKGIFVLHPVVQVIQGLILIIISGYVLITLSNNQQNIFSDSRFWLAAAVLIYFLTLLFISSISSVLTSPDNKQLQNLWIINSIANMLSHVLFIIFFIWNSRRKTLSY